MTRFKFLSFLIYIEIAAFLGLILKAIIYPAGKGEVLAGVDEIIIALAILAVLALTLLVYAYFKVTESRNPTLKKTKSLWQIIALLFILTICFGIYAQST